MENLQKNLVNKNRNKKKLFLKKKTHKTFMIAK